MNKNEKSAQKRYEEPLKLLCAICGAQPGELCKSKSVWIHLDRFRSAARVVAQSRRIDDSLEAQAMKNVDPSVEDELRLREEYESRFGLIFDEDWRQLKELFNRPDQASLPKDLYVVSELEFNEDVAVTWGIPSYTLPIGPFRSNREAREWAQRVLTKLSPSGGSYKVDRIQAPRG